MPITVASHVPNISNRYCLIMKIKTAILFKSTEHIKEKGDGSYLVSAGSYLVSDPSDLATCSQNEYCNCNFNRILHTRSSIIQM